jgi:preprotein translocase subunit SecA
MLGIDQFFYKLFGTPSERRLKGLRSYLERINELEPEMEKLSDEDFPKKTQEFQKQIKAQLELIDPSLEKEERQKHLNAALWEILPEAFALVREAAKRVLKMRHYDVQMYGGMILHDGGISEMRTGEGKTLVATAPVYLNALSGKGVHVGWLRSMSSAA